ncbi:MAG: hypothetical protein HFJ95_07660 [Muribaculaceae bacterium]|jgi:FKBP-type peptidyl-prolyl cis-trans isomerase FklB|nr:hypothetical protein [Muribaculaceae bacterium]
MKYTVKPILFFLLGLVAFTACNDDENQTTWDEYKEWREDNSAFFEEKKFLMTPEGTNYYQTITPAWNSTAQVLIRYLNDRSLTAGNLSPMLTSTVDVKYIGRLYNGEAFDSSYNLKVNGDSIFRTSLTSLIQGWQIALVNMHVGDSVEIVLPYNMGYGTTQSGIIKPYSTLIFNLKLVDIPYYEVRP